MPMTFVNPAPGRRKSGAGGRSRRRNGDLRVTTASRLQRRAQAAPARRAAKVTKARASYIKKEWSRAPLSRQGMRVLDHPGMTQGYSRFASNPKRSKSGRFTKNWGRYGAASRTIGKSSSRSNPAVVGYRNGRPIYGGGGGGGSSKKKRSRAARAAVSRSTHKRKKKKMAKRKKLYGAAARAHAKKLGRSKKRKGRKSGSRKSTKRVRAARKAARTRKAKKAARSAAARKGARRRKGKGGHRKVYRGKRRQKAVAAYSKRRRKGGGKRRRKGSSRKRSRSRRRHSSPRRRRRRGGRPATQRSMLRARRTIRNRRKTALARATQRRYRMRSNPDIMGLAKAVVPVALSLYGARFIANQVASMGLPGLSSVPPQFQGLVMGGLVMGAAHFITKKVGALQKYHPAVMIGTGINLVDQLLVAFAPPSVRAAFGLGDIYDRALGEYVNVGEYVDVGATPIDDDLTLRDYIEVGALQEELGLEEELGVEEDLGSALDRSYLGGVGQGSLLKRVPMQPLLAPVPSRSFTKDVRTAGSGYDNSNTLYGGIFGGGF